jgi:aryl-alcohol dehydrogenase-like predicted oxidoreductase
MNKKIILGTAQFSGSYGILNEAKENIRVNKILNIAEKGNIKFLDTAYNYGKSQSLIGKYGAEKFKIISKIPNLDNNSNTIDFIRKSLDEIFNDLKIKKIDTILFHDSNQLLSKKGEELFEALNRYKDNKLIKKIGASIYNDIDSEKLLNHFDLDVIQAPFNLFDNENLKNGFLSKIKSRNIEFHARSIFLQGVLLSKVQDIPQKLCSLFPNLEILDEFCIENKITRLEACLNYVNSVNEIDYMVVGVDNEVQLNSILKIKPESFNFKNLKFQKNNFIDPRIWK